MDDGKFASEVTIETMIQMHFSPSVPPTDFNSEKLEQEATPREHCSVHSPSVFMGPESTGHVYTL